MRLPLQLPLLVSAAALLMVERVDAVLEPLPTVGKVRYEFIKDFADIASTGFTIRKNKK